MLHATCFCIPDIKGSIFRLLQMSIQVHFTLDFFMDANKMNPDQTAPKEAV